MEEVTASPSATEPSSALALKFTGYQKFVVAMLAFLQFTIILDFMILSPLGAMLIPDLHISPSQFGLVVSVYAFSAGASGLLAAGFADRFDRKKLLLFFYTGFLAGTVFCGLAPTYELLLMARMITGVFGGVIGSVVFAITTDLFPMAMRGRVMGVVQGSFAASQVMGIPIGLYMANHWGWHAPFLLIVGVGLVVGVVIAVALRPINEHLRLKNDRNPFHHLWTTLIRPKYLQAYAATALLSTGGFMLMPFSSAFSVQNLKVDMEHLPWVYMVTGICAMIAGPLLGRFSDQLGKYRMLAAGTVLSSIMVLIYTNLGATPISIVILVNCLLFVGISSRMISSSALLSGVPDPVSRGAFMAINSSMQQISGGVAAAAAGLIVVQAADGKIEHFGTLGLVVVVAMVLTLWQMYWVDRSVAESIKR